MNAQQQPSYKSHEMPNGVEIREVISNPSSFEPLGKCHLYFHGYYRFTCADLIEATTFSGKAGEL